MVQMQRWAQVELARVDQTCAQQRLRHGAGSPQPAMTFAELASSLRGSSEVCEQLMTRLTAHVVGGTSGGDDIAAEILREVWQVHLRVVGLLQVGLKGEVKAARLRAEAAEDAAVAAQEKADMLEKEAEARNMLRGRLRNGRGGAGVGLDDGADDVDFNPGSDSALGSGNGPKSGQSSTPEGAESSQAAAAAAAAALREMEVEVSRLRHALDAKTRELAFAQQRAEALEGPASQAVEALSRAEAAEAARAEAVAHMQQLTPRPRPEHRELHALLGPAGAETALAALQAHPDLAPAALAEMMLTKDESSERQGEQTSSGSASAATGAAPAEPVVVHLDINSSTVAQPQTGLTTEAPTKSSEGGQCTTTSSSSSQDPGVQAPVLQATHSVASTSDQPQDGAPSSVNLMKTLDPPSLRGCLVASDVASGTLAAALARARGTTAQRYTALEVQVVALMAESASLRAETEAYREAEHRREAARRRREEETQLESKNAIQRYLDLLSAQGEEAWKEQLIGMGQAPDVPKLFRHAGKVRNKHLSKRDTEKLVKELWKERLTDPAVVAGRAGELVDFLGQHLQKKVGIATAVIEVRGRGLVVELVTLKSPPDGLYVKNTSSAFKYSEKLQISQVCGAQWCSNLTTAFIPFQLPCSWGTTFCTACGCTSGTLTVSFS